MLYFVEIVCIFFHLLLFIMRIEEKTKPLGGGNGIESLYGRRPKGRPEGKDESTCSRQI